MMQPKYFRGPWLPSVGRATLALAYDEAVPPTVYAEAFVFVENDGEEVVFEQRFSASRKDIAPLGNPRDVMEDEALLWAQCAVDNHMMMGGDRIIPPAWQWMPLAGKPLLGFWMRGKFCGQIVKCRRVTKSEAFRNELGSYSEELKGCLTQDDLAALCVTTFCTMITRQP